MDKLFISNESLVPLIYFVCGINDAVTFVEYDVMRDVKILLGVMEECLNGEDF